MYVSDEFTVLSNSSLLIDDVDSPAESLMYSILSSSSSYKFLRLPKEQVNNFTQHDVNSRRIVLQCSGENQHFLVISHFADSNNFDAFND